MNIDLVLGAAFLLLTAVILMLRTKCNYLVLALCAGFVLASTLQDNIYNLSAAVDFSLPGISLAQIVQLVITLFPAGLVAGRFYKSQRGVGLVQQLAPALGTVGLLIVFIQPILEQASVQDTLDTSVLWGMFTTYRLWIILFAVGVSLMGIMLEQAGPKRGRPKKKD